VNLKNGKILREKKQVIFYGRPGTGKTFVATEFSKYLTYKYGGMYEIVQFHPSYSYEDFVDGIKPKIRNGILEYIAQDAIFKKFCKLAYTIIIKIFKCKISR
jgi:5-methylcytosine-specific restriction enzyme B